MRFEVEVEVEVEVEPTRNPLLISDSHDGCDTVDKILDGVAEVHVWRLTSRVGTVDSVGQHRRLLLKQVDVKRRRTD